MRRAPAARPVFALLCSSLTLSSPLLAQRSDRAVIGGLVTERQGGAGPGREFPGDAEPERNASYYGNGAFQRIARFFGKASRHSTPRERRR